MESHATDRWIVPASKEGIILALDYASSARSSIKIVYLNTLARFQATIIGFSIVREDIWKVSMGDFQEAKEE